MFGTPVRVRKVLEEEEPFAGTEAANERNLDRVQARQKIKKSDQKIRLKHATDQRAAQVADARHVRRAWDRTAYDTSRISLDEGRLHVVCDSSISEHKLLATLDLSEGQQRLIGGLQSGPSSSSTIVGGGIAMKETQLAATLALIQLARDPPSAVGAMQRRTSRCLC
eukprot:5709931-Prymnesium_polylepis.1